MIGGTKILMVKLLEITYIDSMLCLRYSIQIIYGRSVSEFDKCLNKYSGLHISTTLGYFVDNNEKMNIIIIIIKLYNNIVS